MLTPMVAEPVPDAGVTDIQLVELAAVQAHPGPVLTARVVSPPAGGAVNVAGAIW